MAPELAGSQISALLESVPGIANVLRSPVADAIANLIRAAAGLADFRREDAEELVQYAVRRGLIGSSEGERILNEVAEAAGKRKAKAAAKQAHKRRPRLAVRKSSSRTHARQGRSKPSQPAKKRR